MSDFDPFKLYQKHYKKSYTGQVIRKKPTENIYAFTQRDLKQAIKIIEAYGYSLAQPIPPGQISIYGGVLNNDTISYSDLVNSDVKNYLLRYNSHIFDRIYENFKFIITIDYAYLSNDVSMRGVEFNLVDGTSKSFPNYALLKMAVIPYSSTKLFCIYGEYDEFLTRGQTETYNNGLIYEITDSSIIYQAFLNNDYSSIPDVLLGSITSPSTHNTYWGYTITIILN